MEYAIGIGLALGVGAFASVAGLERDRALYPVMMIVIASYYDLFAVMGGDRAVLAVEIAITAGFIGLSVIGFRTHLWIVAAALFSHGILDVFHGDLIENPGVPEWWPMFCASFDVAAGGYLGWRLAGKHIEARWRFVR